MTPVEILLADDKELNEFVSLKKFAPYRRPDLQEDDIMKYSKKKRIQMFRHKLKSQIQQQELQLDKDWDPTQRRKKENKKRSLEDTKKDTKKKDKRDRKKND